MLSKPAYRRESPRSRCRLENSPTSAVRYERPSRITIVVLDMVNTRFASQARARIELLKFLAANLRADEPTALLTIGRNGVRQIHPFTNDPQLLIAALKKVTSSTSHMEARGSSRTTPLIRRR